MFNLKSKSITKPYTRLVPHFPPTLINTEIPQYEVTSEETLHIHSHGCGFAHQMTFSMYGGELIVNLHMTQGHVGAYAVSVTKPDDVRILFFEFDDCKLAVNKLTTFFPKEFESDILSFINGE